MSDHFSIPISRYPKLQYYANLDNNPNDFSDVDAKKLRVSSLEKTFDIVMNADMEERTKDLILLTIASAHSVKTKTPIESDILFKKYLADI